MIMFQTNYALNRPLSNNKLRKDGFFLKIARLFKMI